MLEALDGLEGNFGVAQAILSDALADLEKGSTP
jgi:hypothetical protein